MAAFWTENPDKSPIQPSRIMSTSKEIPIPPKTPASCYSPHGVRAFLRLSRSYTDDVISQKLNALLDNRSHRDKLLELASSKDLPSAFTEKFLFPAWRTRDDLISYCDGIAKTKDTSTLDKLEDDDKGPIDPRIDSYGARDYETRRIQKVSEIQRWVFNETSVEEIVKERTAEVLADKCGDLLRLSNKSSISNDYNEQNSRAEFWLERYEEYKKI